MKKIFLSLLAIGSLINCFAQNEFKKTPSIGIHFFYNDFQTAKDLRTQGLANVIRDNNWKKTSRMTPGLAVSFLKGINDKVDFITTASGSFVEYPVPTSSIDGSSRFLLDVTAVTNIKLLSDKYTFTPYLSAGLGASKYGGYYGAFIPAGVGLQFNIFDEAFLLINSQYRIPVTENVAYHLYHSIGFAGNVVKRKVAEPAPLPEPPVVAPADRDNDGIVDSKDKCPDVAGLAALEGCPDQDNDGIADGDDKCPGVAGLSKYQGCPIPDTDKDGINDETDKCIDVAGVARYQGCPVPDADKDGVNDEEDKCPSEVGPSSNFGCPIIEQAIIQKVNKAAENIFFATGSSKLLAKSFPLLNGVVTILKDNPTYRVDLDGHTDNVGTAVKNQQLSEARANSVKAFLKSKGVDESRIVATGFGFDNPVADNKTAAGRAKNRRIEIKLKNY
ncbi:MAG: OmpA family protein [Ferruginibacter sp.]|nr:OmpA family protein [Ferruginibacter sp.]